jgi:hypothetical protein
MLASPYPLYLYTLIFPPTSLSIFIPLYFLLHPCLDSVYAVDLLLLRVTSLYYFRQKATFKAFIAVALIHY